MLNFIIGLFTGVLFGISLTALINIIKEKQNMCGAETCIICGKVIPEGCQVCSTCMEKEEIEVVDTTRCKDCKKFRPYDTRNGRCTLYESISYENNSCNFGRKKSEVEDDG